KYDILYVHVEAPDEAGHNGDIWAKIKAIEDFDSKVTATIIKGLVERGESYRVLILPDHPTPVKRRTHTGDPVPFAMVGTGIDPDEVTVFSENSAKAGSLRVAKGSELMRVLLAE
ncbi:MAG: phosphoglycerate mutase, partial [Candidatus Omnitrophica bacterium]|nr:phosphoglycerate mutase [Candidatus Omnitrophota bacterium]